MKFSIVIAAYNAEKTIEATLQSCFEQSYTPYEIIVVNDASTDSTINILNQFSDKISILNHQQNKGVSAARNSGWELATGDYVAFLDSDDIWDRNKLHIVATTIERNKNIPFVAHNFCVEKKGISDTNNTILLSFTKLLLHNKIQGSCIVAKRTILQRFDETMRYSEDYDFALRCAYQQPILFINASLSTLSRPQQSIGGLSANLWAMRKGELYLFSKLGQLNPLLFFAIPFLWLYSLCKHLVNKLKLWLASQQP